MGLALGYEDLNDHDYLRLDPLLAAACGKALAGKSTLNRLELAAAEPDSRYKKIVANPERIEDL